MTPERFDALTRLWFTVPSRRAFVGHLCAVAFVGAFGRFGFRRRGCRLARAHEQCYPERDGMLCAGCGICQRGVCIPNAETCRRVAMSYGRTTSCARCDPRVLGCVAGCRKNQVCCKD